MGWEPSYTIKENDRSHCDPILRMVSVTNIIIKAMSKRKVTILISARKVPTLHLFLVKILADESQL